MLASIMVCFSACTSSCVQSIGIGPRAHSDLSVALTSGRIRPVSLPRNTKIMPRKSPRSASPGKEITNRLGIIRESALCPLCRYRHNGHWTSTAGRCDRQLGKRFGDQAHSVEELVAELTAAFTLAHLGLSSDPLRITPSTSRRG